MIGSTSVLQLVRVRAHNHANYVVSFIGLALLTVAAWIATISVFRSGHGLGDFFPACPWW